MSSGVAGTINQISDNELVTSYRYTDLSNVNHVVISKRDTFGNLLKEKELILNEETIANSVITSDNKILLIAGHHFSNWQMYMYKLTFDLEYDSLDTKVYYYDSLCPNVVYADTIDLDCDLIVDVQQPLLHPEQGKLKISPNPATEYINITLPDFYSSWSTTAGMGVQTTWYTYPRQMTLEVVDMMGRQVYHNTLENNQKEFRIDVSGFPGGMMLVRIMANGKTLTSGKFIR
ncbi:MAG: T9SS type A sorting domain-containing protein [Bacteroidetes bacterium]|nr:T9SS type A sorting domain-containing protein [Bacteroidota bacterium]